MGRLDGGRLTALGRMGLARGEVKLNADGLPCGEDLAQAHRAGHADEVGGEEIEPRVRLQVGGQLEFFRARAEQAPRPALAQDQAVGGGQPSDVELAPLVSRVAVEEVLRGAALALVEPLPQALAQVTHAQADVVDPRRGAHLRPALRLAWRAAPPRHPPARAPYEELLRDGLGDEFLRHRRGGLGLDSVHEIALRVAYLDPVEHHARALAQSDGEPVHPVFLDGDVGGRAFLGVIGAGGAELPNRDVEVESLAPIEADPEAVRAGVQAVAEGGHGVLAGGKLDRELKL